MAAALAVPACAPSDRAAPRGGPQAGAGDAARATCPTGPLGPSFDRELPRGGRHAAGLLDRAVLHEVNTERCRRGLAPVATSGHLGRAAQLHANDMARLGFFDHISRVPARRTLGDRLGAAGAPASRAGENIIEAHFAAYENGTRYEVIDARRCRYVDARGRRIPRHSYASLAREVVGRWMDSPGHRRNVLEPRYRRHGFGMAPNGRRTLCGGLFAAQVFSD